MAIAEVPPLAVPSPTLHEQVPEGAETFAAVDGFAKGRAGANISADRWGV